jgi:hypothetical protein
MEFKIKQSILKEELGFIQGVVERKTTIPVLSNILIESIGEKEIRIIGTDLDATIRCDAEAEIMKAGAICIQARKLFDLVRALPAGSDVHFKKEDNQWVVMKRASSRFRLAGVSREQFPEIPQFVLELGNYTMPDKKITQDCVMALICACGGIWRYYGGDWQEPDPEGETIQIQMPRMARPLRSRNLRAA